MFQGSKFLLQIKVEWYLPTPMTHVVRVADAAGNDYPQPQKRGQFHGTQGALDHDLSRVEKPHPSPQCHGIPSHSRGAGNRGRRVREAPVGNITSGKHAPRAPEGFHSTGWARFLPAPRAGAGLESLPQGALRAVPTSSHYLERESYVDGHRSSDGAQA